MTAPWDSLLQTARTVRTKAYAPYSRYQVGAAVLTGDGKVYGGCNVENASYGATICAERSAILQAVAQEGAGMRLAALVVVTGGTEPAPPCGICLQVIQEFADGSLPIRLASPENDGSTTSLSALLPRGFSGKALNGG